MGYTRTFVGSFQLSRKLTAAQSAYLQAFADTRRMKRDPALLEIVPDPLREAVGLPLGPEGGFFIGDGELRSEDHLTVVDGDEPPQGQPGLWCRWAPSAGGTAIQWSGFEKFYHHVEWLEYLCEHFLEPWGYTLEGQVDWIGQDGEQQGDEQHRICAARILMTYPGPHGRLAAAILRKALKDRSPKVRVAAMEGLESYPEEYQV
jgi:hypothetical protein